MHNAPSTDRSSSRAAKATERDGMRSRLPCPQRSLSTTPCWGDNERLESEATSITIRLLIADNHGVVRQGLRMLLSLDPDPKVVGDPKTAQEPSSWPESPCPTWFSWISLCR
jgi:hypothetical protein